MVYDWPDEDGMQLWETYRDIRHSELREGGDGSGANQFVTDNYEAMHRGTRVGWEARKGALSDDEDEQGVECVSALQYAFNLRFQDEAAFFAEYQNEPLSSVNQKAFDLKVNDIAERVGAYERNVVPNDCEKLVAFIDIQKNALYYVVMAWTMKGRGHVIDYSTFPDQKRTYFLKRQITKTLQKAAGTSVTNDAIYAGLESLTERLLSKVYERSDGAQFQIDRLGIDARWGNATRTIRRFCRENKFRAKTIPCMGYYIGRNNLQWAQWTHKKGSRLGVHYKLEPPPAGQPGSRDIMADSNYWKSWVAQRLSTHKGSDKAILLFRANPTVHRMFAEHCCIETAVEAEGKSGNVVIEWDQGHSSADNEFWDCLYNCSVLAHMEGVPLEDGVSKTASYKPVRKRKRRRRKVSDLPC